MRKSAEAGLAPAKRSSRASSRRRSEARRRHRHNRPTPHLEPGKVSDFARDGDDPRFHSHPDSEGPPTRQSGWFRPSSRRGFPIRRARPVTPAFPRTRINPPDISARASPPRSHRLPMRRPSQAPGVHADAAGDRDPPARHATVRSILTFSVSPRISNVVAGRALDHEEIVETALSFSVKDRKSAEWRQFSQRRQHVWRDGLGFQRDGRLPLSAC